MAKHIHQCPVCKAYTMKESCRCGAKTINPRPAKYSPSDPYGKYRRAAKREELEERNIL